MRIGVARAILPTSSSFCMIFLIRAYDKPLESHSMHHKNTHKNGMHTIGNKVLYFFFILAGALYDSFTTQAEGSTQTGPRHFFRKGLFPKLASSLPSIKFAFIQQNRWSHRCKKKKGPPTPRAPARFSGHLARFPTLSNLFAIFQDLEIST